MSSSQLDSMQGRIPDICVINDIQHYMLFLKFHKLYKIPQKGQFFHYGPSRGKYCMQISSDFHFESSDIKNVSQVKISTMLLSKTKIPWQTVSSQSSALTSKVCFCHYIFTRKNYSQYNLWTTHIHVKIQSKWHENPLKK